MNVVQVAFCVWRMRAGMVKRCMMRGPLLGYTMACPHCGHREMYTHDEHAFQEEGATDHSPYPKRIVRMGAPIACRVCARKSTIVDGQWVDP